MLKTPEYIVIILVCILGVVLVGLLFIGLKISSIRHDLELQAKKKKRRI